MQYEIYPCDVDIFGECPKKCKDCENCQGWNFSEIEWSDEDDPT